MIRPLLFAGALITFGVQAQNLNGAEAAPHVANNSVSANKTLWDVQYSFDATTAANNTVGQAAVAYVNGEIWTSMWQYDTIIRYSSTGSFISKFVIAGLSGTRSITSDGTSLYLGNATNTITILNPSTQLITGTITSSAPVTSRFLTYDPTLDGGNGGFWTGNFNTDIVSISMSGTVLSTITAATHTLSGMYGAAYDGTTSGGPYLWVYHQGGTANCQITAIQLPTGTPTVYTHDVFSDISTLHGSTSGLAGGAFFSTNYFPGQNTLLVLTQGTPANIVTAYDTDVSNLTDDVAITALRSTHGYTQIPSTQAFGETYEISYANQSVNTIDTIFANVEYYFNGGLVSSQTLSALNVASGGSGVLTTSTIPMNQGKGMYDLQVNVYPNAAFTDNANTNDTLTYSFELTDSTYARDNGVFTANGYTVSTTDSAYAVSLYELFTQDTIIGINILLEPNTLPDAENTFGLIYNYDGSLPSTEIARGIPVTMSLGQSEYYLQFQNEVILPTGTYAFGCFEPLNTGISLLQSNDVYTPGTNYFYVSGAWSASGIATARAIHPVFKHQMSGAGLKNITLDNVLLYPNPTSGFVKIDLGDYASNVSVQVVDLNGRIMLEKTIEVNAALFELNLQNLQAGTYFVHITGDQLNAVKQLNKQ